MKTTTFFLGFIVLCISTLFTSAFISAQTIQASDTVGCAPMSVTFSSTLAGVQSYQWSFGNGASSTIATPVVLFQNTGDYDVTLEVVMTNGNTDTFDFEDFIKVKEEPVTDFSVSTPSLCLLDSVSFTNTSIGADTYIWDFGDGANSTLENPKYSYKSPGIYTVTLIAFNEFGCTNVKIESAAITVEGIDGLDFSSDITQACLSDAVINFTTQQYSSYLWDFGDGNTSVEQNPSHRYFVPGTYDVSLTVSDANGCNGEIIASEHITVHELPEIVVEWTDAVVCAGQEVEFTNLTSDTDSITWTFSDGFTSNDEQFSRVFNTPDQLSFTVQVTNSNGCSQVKSFRDSVDVRSASPPDIDISTTQGCAPLTVQFANNTTDAVGYSWEVNGLPFSDQSFEYTFERKGLYSIVATTQHVNGCETTVVYDSIIEVNSPIMVASASDYRGCAPFFTSFRLNNNQVTNVLWDFGDGNFSNSITPTNTYASAGEYNVSVSFINEFGCAQQLELPREMQVSSPGIDYQSPGVLELCESQSITFFGGVGRDFWEWDFGDGETSQEINPTHRYKTPGQYIVSLKTNNVNGCESTIAHHSEVIVNDIDFSFTHTLTDSTTCPKFTIQFNTPITDYASVKWSFGDGAFSSELNPSHSYTSLNPRVVTLTVTNNSGCTRSKARVITSPWVKCAEDAPDQPDEDPDDPDGGLPRVSYVHLVESCSAPFELSLTNPKSNAASWLWNFGDGNTSNAEEPVHVYQNTGEYIINLISTSASGNVDTLDNYINVKIYDQNTDFTFVESPACEGVEVSFSNSDPALISWQWNFGDSTTSILRSPVKNYTDEGVYPVSLTSLDTLGCSSTLVKNVVVGNVFPQFTYDEILCFGDTLNINHNLGNFAHFVWDFGDGTIMTDQYPNHIYNAGGSYQVRLTTIDEFGCEDYYDLPHEVIVNNPISNFGISGQSGSCNSLRVLFRNLSVDAERWLWDFGNGQTSTLENPSFIFAPGTYNISLTSYFDDCSSTITMNDLIQVDSLQADFGFVWEKSCLPAPVQFQDRSNQAVKWLWDFGDGASSTLRNPRHVYKKFPHKPVTLEVESANGCTSKITRSLPGFTDTFFSSDAKVGCLPFTVNFKDKSTESVSWFWDFGDGNTSTQQDPSHTYTANGEFDVTLVTKSLTGCYDTLVKGEWIKTGSLSVDFEAKNDESLCTPLVVRFTSLATSATTYLWDFGDGTSSTQENPIHVYAKVGQFDVSLIASNEFGCKDTITYTNLITSLGPDAGFSISETEVCHPTTIHFTDTSAAAVEWQWFFGDGNISNEQHPSYEYTQPGSYIVSLLARDQNGCEQLVSYDAIKVYPQPVAQFDIEEFDACQPATLALINNSTNLQNHTFQWDFGNGTVSNKVTPDLQYNVPGTYNISLSVTNENTCSDTFIYDQDIVVRDTFHLKEPNILQLSVTPENNIELLRAPYQRNNYRYEIVFRKPYGEDEFQIIDTLYNPMDTVYVDNTVRANEGSYEYKLQSYVYCNDTVELASLNTYQSIFMTSEAKEDGIYLNWTPYKGHQFDGYAIMRKEQGQSWIAVAEVSLDQNDFVDIEDLCPAEYAYRVEARNLNNTGFNSNSNEQRARPVKNVFLEQSVEIIRSTVVGTQILTEWKEPIIGPDKVLSYEVYRSFEGEPFTLISTVPKGITTFLDSDVAVQEEKYVYRIDIINTCNVDGPYSNNGVNILLQKTTNQYTNWLFWNLYQQWQEGVYEYQLQQKNEYGEWETMKSLPPKQQSIIIDLRQK